MGGFGAPPRANSPVRRGRLGSASVRLPVEGRQGHPPVFPLPRPTKREQELWGELWATPQAVMWERTGWTHVAARYVRVLARAERPKAPVSLMAEGRRLEEALGLTDMAMLRLRWTIEDGPVDAGTEAESKGILDIRERLQAVE